MCVRVRVCMCSSCAAVHMFTRHSGPAEACCAQCLAQLLHLETPFCLRANVLQYVFRRMADTVLLACKCAPIRIQARGQHRLVPQASGWLQEREAIMQVGMRLCTTFLARQFGYLLGSKACMCANPPVHPWQWPCCSTQPMGLDLFKSLSGSADKPPPPCCCRSLDHTVLAGLCLFRKVELICAASLSCTSALWTSAWGSGPGAGVEKPAQVVRQHADRERTTALSRPEQNGPSQS